GLLPEASRKPLILTEIGWPATGHEGNAIEGAIFESPETRQKAAEVISRMIPKVFESNLILGMTYFEFSDEWWKEPPNNATTWDGAASRDPGMPNGFHDQEGFGLFSTALGAGRTSTSQSPVTGNPVRPVYPVDPYFERVEMTSALKAVFDQF
ncbi:MAG: hypothetical protein KC800_32925, partial [Candidatus Eremiobacteraeota bacterium]|nr:hypothetical protein [Candidatus Eremiobacteraeota bacterium]